MWAEVGNPDSKRMFFFDLTLLLVILIEILIKPKIHYYSGWNFIDLVENHFYDGQCVHFIDKSSFQFGCPHTRKLLDNNSYMSAEIVMLIHVLFQINIFIYR